VRYEKWKNKTKNGHQIINNLNQQIFVLQNNLPINIQVNMALQPLPLPNFSGEYDEDIDIFISQLSSYFAGVAVDPIANRDQAFGILRGCLSGRALE
jgi:hypothetical protein